MPLDPGSPQPAANDNRRLIRSAASDFNPRQQQQIRNLCRLGPRIVGEVLLRVDDGDKLAHVLDLFEHLTPKALAFAWADDFPATPISPAPKR